MGLVATRVGEQHFLGRELRMKWTKNSKGKGREEEGEGH